MQPILRMAWTYARPIRVINHYPDTQPVLRSTEVRYRFSDRSCASSCWIRGLVSTECFNLVSVYVGTVLCVLPSTVLVNIDAETFP